MSALTNTQSSLFNTTDKGLNHHSTATHTRQPSGTFGLRAFAENNKADRHPAPSKQSYLLNIEEIKRVPIQKPSWILEKEAQLQTTCAAT
jgi:hypothetical protein